MGLAKLFEFRAEGVGEVEKKKLEEIKEQIREQCRMLYGKIEETKISETTEALVCRFLEPKGITRVDFEEVEGEGGKLYIESEEGYHGVKVDVGDIGTRVEVLGATGDAMYDNSGYIIPSRKRTRHFAIFKRKDRRKVIKRTEEIIYMVSPNFIHVYV